MATSPPPPAHVWYRPADLAAMLDAHQHGDKWRARCPAHGGDNPQALSIAEGVDKDGNPRTLLYCHAHQCTVEAICTALGIEVRNLFCLSPQYTQAMRHFPPARSPRIARLRTMEEPTSDDIVQVLLEELIVSDPEWIQTCAPAREKMWELAQTSPQALDAFNRALRHTTIIPAYFWATLAHEHEGPGHGSN